MVLLHNLQALQKKETLKDIHYQTLLLKSKDHKSYLCYLKILRFYVTVVGIESLESLDAWM